MPSHTVEYGYHFASKGARNWATSFKLVLDSETLQQVRELPEDMPDWARLDCFKCKCCPLDSEKHPWCPAAASLVDVVGQLTGVLSFDRVEVTIVSSQRTTIVNSTAQKALSSLIGLCGATSGCPVLAKFRPMARFHLPFSTLHETMFRAVGAYLLAQYFAWKQGKEPDLDLTGLKEFYARIHAVNVGLTARLRDAVETDAHVNALVNLDVFAQELPASIESHLAELEPLFAPFLNDQEGH